MGNGNYVTPFGKLNADRIFVTNTRLIARLDVKGEKITLKGNLPARLFRQNQIPEELESGSDLSFLGSM